MDGKALTLMFAGFLLLYITAMGMLFFKRLQIWRALGSGEPFLSCKERPRVPGFHTACLAVMILLLVILPLLIEVLGDPSGSSGFIDLIRYASRQAVK